MESFELFLISEFYDKHQTFVKVMNNHSGAFNNVGTLLALSVSHGALDSGKTKMELGVPSTPLKHNPLVPNIFYSEMQRK